MIGKAYLMRPLPGYAPAHTRALYRLSPPLAYECWDDEAEDDVEREAAYVVVSASVAPYSGPETYIFPADAQGEITSWGELDGSLRGVLDHQVALLGAGDGYEIVDDVLDADSWEVKEIGAGE